MINWSAELSGNATNRNRNEGQAGQVSAGIAKQLFSNKASLKLKVRDIFYARNSKENQNFQDVQSTLQPTETPGYSILRLCMGLAQQ